MVDLVGSVGFGLLVMMLLVGVALAWLRAAHDKPRVLLVILVAHLFLLVLSGLWDDKLEARQRFLQRDLDPGPEMLVALASLRRWMSFQTGCARGLLGGGFLLSFAGLKGGIAWAILPCIFWGVVVAIALFGLMGLRPPTGVLG